MYPYNYVRQTDAGPNPIIISVERTAFQNCNFRKAVWTGKHLQMTVMSILPEDEIGFEMHENTDQLIRIEEGSALVQINDCKGQRDFQQSANKGDAIFIPAGTWHNVINTGRCPLKVTSVYAPPNHPKGTVHVTKEDAQESEAY